MEGLFAFIEVVKLGKMGELLKKIQNILGRNTTVELEKTLSSGKFSF